MELGLETDTPLLLELNHETISKQYNNQIDYIFGEIEKGIDKIEEELVNKWNLESDLYMTDRDNPLNAYLYNKMESKYFYAVDISEMANERFIDNIKNEIIKGFNTALDKYENNHHLVEKNKEEIRKDIERLVNKNVDSITSKLFNNKVRDNLENLCNRWNQAYENKDYSKADKISDKIVNFIDRPDVYKDDKLNARAEKIIYKNELIQNKLKNGKDGELSELEENTLNILVPEPYVGKRSKQLQNNIEKYLRTASKEDIMDKEEMRELKKLEETILKQADKDDDFVYNLLDSGKENDRIENELEKILKDLDSKLENNGKM